MSAFVISYVPNVENVENIELLKKVNHLDNVGNVEKIELLKRANQLDNVGNVEKVEQVDNVTNVETVQDVMTVHDVRKLPHPYFPLKVFNYQQGGSIHVTATKNTYQAVYTPDIDCEFKGIHLCFTSYNIEDTYDVMIGSRYVMKGSHVKEMSEYRILEVYEVVPAGTPIVIVFHNNSGLEKFMLYEIITLVDEAVINNSGVMEWNFTWEDSTIEVGEQDLCTLIINQPNYVNMDSSINSFELEITNLNTQLRVANIYGNGTVYSDYIEQEPTLEYLGLLGRVNVIGIVAVTKYDKSIHIVFKNINSTGTVDPHPIELGVSGIVLNNINGGF